MMETHKELFGEELAQMVVISSKLNERQFDAIVTEAMEIAFTNFDYKAEGFDTPTIIEALGQAIASFIKV